MEVEIFYCNDCRKVNEIKEILMDVLWQACGITPPKGTAIEDMKDEFDSQCLKPYEEALAFAVKNGWIKKRQVVR